MRNSKPTCGRFGASNDQLAPDPSALPHVARVGDGQRVEHTVFHGGPDPAIGTERSDATSEFAVVVHPECREAGAVTGSHELGGADLTTRHGHDIGGDPGVEAEAPLGTRHDRTGEELLDGEQQLEHVGCRVRPRRRDGRAEPLDEVLDTDRLHAEQQEQVVLGLTDASADGGQLHRTARAAQVGGALQRADHPPAQRAQDLPPVRRLTIDGGAAGSLVGIVEDVAFGQPGHREAVPEAPGPHAEPSEVLERVSEVGEFPVEHGDQSRVIDEEVAEAEVAVDDPGSHRWRAVLGQPVQGELERGARHVESIEERPQLPQRVVGPQVRHDGGIDAVDGGECRSGLWDEPGAGIGVLVVAEQTRRQGLTAEAAGNDERRTEHGWIVTGADHRRHGDASRCGGGQQALLPRHPPGEWQRPRPGALHDEILGVGLRCWSSDRAGERLTRRAAREALECEHLVAVAIAEPIEVPGQGSGVELGHGHQDVAGPPSPPPRSLSSKMSPTRGTRKVMRTDSTPRAQTGRPATAHRRVVRPRGYRSLRQPGRLVRRVPGASDSTAVAYLLAALVMIVGAAVQGAVGFGANLFAAPLLVLIDPAYVPVAVIVPSLTLNALVLRTHNEPGTWRSVRWANVGQFPGALAGAGILALIAREHVAVFFSSLILLAVALSVIGLRVRRTDRTLLGTGFVTGFMGTAVGIGGPPMALVYQDVDGPTLRASLSRVFFAGSCISLFGLTLFGRVHLHDLLLGLALVPGTIAGFILSAPLRARVDHGRVRSAVLVLSTASAALVLGRALW